MVQNLNGRFYSLYLYFIILNQKKGSADLDSYTFSIIKIGEIVVEEICGKKPEGAELPEIKEGEMFVFNSDPNFIDITLYEPSGGIASVRSWVECAHYVNGGWVPNTELIISTSRSFEIYLIAIGIIFFATLLLFIQLISKKKFRW